MIAVIITINKSFTTYNLLYLFLGHIKCLDTTVLDSHLCEWI